MAKKDSSGEESDFNFFSFFLKALRAAYPPFTVYNIPSTILKCSLRESKDIIFYSRFSPAKKYRLM